MRHRRSGAGYSLAEVVVSLTVFIAILLGVLFIFNLNYRLARNRSDTAHRREVLRSAQHDMVRLVRMAGRGGLPHSLAIDVESNVAPDTRIGGAGSPRIVAGTDVLTVRGVFSTPLFRAGPADGGLRLGGAGASATGVIEIHDPSPQTGVAQDLAEFTAILEARRSGTDALLLVSQLDESIFAVVESAVESAAIGRQGDRVTRVALSFDSAGVPAALTGAGPAAALRGAAFVGILEEYRFYVREAFSAPGDPTSTPRPQLSMARFVPGTDRPWGGTGASLSVDLAENVVDLQVALGVDTDGDGRVAADPEDPGADEWLYNDPADDESEARWARRSATPGLVRLTVVTRAEWPDPDYLAPPRPRLEDRLPEAPAQTGLAGLPGEAHYRRWQLESVVDLKSG